MTQPRLSAATIRQPSRTVAQEPRASSIAPRTSFARGQLLSSDAERFEELEQLGLDLR